jgi:hypothetical protein
MDHGTGSIGIVHARTAQAAEQARRAQPCHLAPRFARGGVEPSAPSRPARAASFPVMLAAYNTMAAATGRQIHICGLHSDARTNDFFPVRGLSITCRDPASCLPIVVYGDGSSEIEPSDSSLISLCRSSCVFALLKILFQQHRPKADSCVAAFSRAYTCGSRLPPHRGVARESMMKRALTGIASVGILAVTVGVETANAQSYRRYGPARAYTPQAYPPQSRGSVRREGVLRAVPFSDPNTPEATGGGSLAPGDRSAFDRRRHRGRRLPLPRSRSLRSPWSRQRLKHSQQPLRKPRKSQPESWRRRLRGSMRNEQPLGRKQSSEIVAIRGITPLIRPTNSGRLGDPKVLALCVA